VNAPAEGKIAKPLLKWVGGKRQLMPELLKYVPDKINTYFEPFIGGGALFWELANQRRFKQAVISDMNLRLVRTYTAIRDHVENVIGLLKEYPYDKDFFYETREKDPDHLGDVGCAAWFIYLNKAGFNGLWRVNKAGKFNVPFGKYTNPTICDADNLRACSAALQGVEIIHGDFEAVVGTRWPAGGHAFVYFDSPYIPLNATSNFASYTADGFGDKDQERLMLTAKWLKRSKSCSVLLSNSSAPRVYEIYKDFEIIEVDARRNVNSKASKRGAVKELLIR